MASPACRLLGVPGGQSVACPRPLAVRGRHGPGLLLVPGLCLSLLPGSLPMSGLFPCRGTGFMGKNSSQLPERRAVIVSLWVALDQRRTAARSCRGSAGGGSGLLFWQEGERVAQTEPRAPAEHRFPARCSSVRWGSAWPPGSRDGCGDGLGCWQAPHFPRLSGNRVP